MGQVRSVNGGSGGSGSSSAVYSASFSTLQGVPGNRTGMLAAYFGGGGIKIIGVSYSFRYESGSPTNNGSNYWEFKLNGSSTGDLTGSTVDTSGDSPGVFEAVNKNATLDVTLSSIENITVIITETGSPTNLGRVACTIHYQLV